MRAVIGTSLGIVCAAFRLAARIELAEAAGAVEAAGGLWRDAQQGLDARAPALTRDWLARQAKAVR